MEKESNNHISASTTKFAALLFYAIPENRSRKHTHTQARTIAHTPSRTHKIAQSHNRTHHTHRTGVFGVEHLLCEVVRGIQQSTPYAARLKVGVDGEHTDFGIAVLHLLNLDASCHDIAVFCNKNDRVVALQSS